MLIGECYTATAIKAYIYSTADPKLVAYFWLGNYIHRCVIQGCRSIDREFINISFGPDGFFPGAAQRSTAAENPPKNKKKIISSSVEVLSVCCLYHHSWCYRRNSFGGRKFLSCFSFVHSCVIMYTIWRICHRYSFSGTRAYASII